MRRLMISHIADIDGMGSVILAKLLFDIDLILTESRYLDEEIDKLIKNNPYDIIYICDLALPYETGVKIMNSNLNVRHFDHHETNKFDFKFSKVEEHRGDYLPCGTSLFYEYLNEEFNFKNYACDTFVEATRSYDTYSFTKDNNKYATILNNLFIEYGTNKYIEVFTDRLKNSDKFYLTDLELKINDKHIKEEQDYIKKCDDNLKIGYINDLKVGLSISDRYRSSVGNYLSNKHNDLDFILIANFDRMSFSLRTTTAFNVGLFALQYGGGGHEQSAGIPFNEKSIKLLDYFVKEEDIKRLRLK